MTIKKGSHHRESGPIKTTMQWIGGFFAVAAICGGFGGAPLGDAILTFAVGAFILWIASQVPDKNVVRW